MRNKKCPTGLQSRPGCETERASHENIRNHTTKRNACQTFREHMRMENDNRPGFWAVIPAVVRYDAQLPPNAKLIYAEISALTDAAGFCFASNAYFQRLFNVSERTVQNLLRALQKQGYIRIEDGNGGAGRRKIYAGINPLSGNPAENCGVTPQKIAGPPAENCGDIKKYNKKYNNPPKAPQGAAGEIWDREAFEAFWALYPKKKDKAKAVTEWNRLKADRKLMRVMSAALRAQMASEEWQRDNGRAIPYPCRWLSHRRWEDEQNVTMPAPREEAQVWL